jgi:tetratricopeptide (TPR) repeat protein
MIYKQLVPTKQWASGVSPPTDSSQQLRGCVSGISSTPGGFEARRAENLAASNHIAEAIGEWTRAIDSYSDVKRENIGYTLDPAWLLSRARLYIKVGRLDDALADIEHSANTPRSFDQVKFNAALLLADLGKYSKSEQLLNTSDLASPSYRPYTLYLRAVVQKKQGKNQLAEQSFKEAATLFAAAGIAPPAQSCLDEIAALPSKDKKSNSKLKIADLAPPRANYEKMERLMKALASRADVFDLDVLKSLTGAASFKEHRSGYFVHPYQAHFKEISLINVHKLESGGKRINIYLVPGLCSINKTALKGLLNHPLIAPEKWRKEVAFCEAYQVPAGSLVLNILNGGFNSVWQVQLYSHDATFPEPQRKQAAEIDSPLQKSHLRLAAAAEALQRGNFDFTEKIANEWLHDEPKNARAHLLQAELLFKQGKLDQALTEIDIAIKYGDNEEALKNKNSGSTLYIKKGTYLLEKGRFDEAYNLFKQGFPVNPSSDQLLLRARAEIGLKMFTEAGSDLKEASKKYYNEGRIVKRDEAEALLLSIEPSAEQRIALDVTKSESEKAAVIVQSLQEEKEQRQLAQMKHNESQVATATCSLILASPQKFSQQSHYLMSLLEMARTAASLGQKATAQSYTDKAIACYQTYTPEANYDNCTRILISQLRVFTGLQFQDRIELIARRSELFCINESFERERDDNFIDLMSEPDAKIAMTERLIAIREELGTKSTNPLKHLMQRLPKNYKGKGQYKQLSEFTIDPRRFYSDKPDTQVASLFVASAQAITDTEKVVGFIRTNDFDQSEKLIDQLDIQLASSSKTDTASFSNSFNKVIKYSQHCAFAQGYLEQGSSKFADKSLRLAISNLSQSDVADLEMSDLRELEPLLKLLSQLRAIYESSQQFEQLESLYDFALSKLEKIKLKDTKPISEIKMRLAEILLNHERHEANKQHGTKLKQRASQLFSESTKAPANRDMAGGSLADIQLRREIAIKYPALIKLDLSNGAIVYEEPDGRQGSRMGGIADGRKLHISGPSSITVIGQGGGRQKILLDGQTLAQKARIQLQAGNLPLAENILTSALRADPNSENFGLLAHCWYRQKRFEEALQAASMALETNSNNKQAAQILRSCQKRLKIPATH